MLTMIKMSRPANLLQPLLALKRHIARHITIKRSPKTYLKQQGWSLAALTTGSEWHGYYRTRWVSVKGRVAASNPPRFYICNPPENLKRHSHWSCFTDQGNGWYSVHFRRMPKDLDSGVMEIERIVSESMKLNK